MSEVPQTVAILTGRRVIRQDTSQRPIYLPSARSRSRDVGSPAAFVGDGSRAVLMGSSGRGGSGCLAETTVFKVGSKTGRISNYLSPMNYAGPQRASAIDSIGRMQSWHPGECNRRCAANRGHMNAS